MAHEVKLLFLKLIANRELKWSLKTASMKKLPLAVLAKAHVNLEIDDLDIPYQNF